MKAIKDFEGYYSVTTDGKVYSHISNRFLKYTGKVYAVVTLCKDGLRSVKNVHRLVAEAYLPNPEDLPQVNHIDGDKRNNHLTNLEWVTASDNLQHAYDNDLRTSRQLHSDEVCHKVCKHYMAGWRLKDIADSLSLTKEQVKHILYRPSYEHVRLEYDIAAAPSRAKRITPEKVILIAEGLERGISGKNIAAKYNVARSLVSAIKTRRLYSDLTNSFNF